MQGYGNRVLVLIVAALLPVVALGSVLIIDIAHLERQRLEAAARAHVETLVARLDSDIESHIRALSVLGASPLLDRDDLSGFREHARRVQERHPLWRNIHLAGSNRRELLDFRLAAAAAAMSVGDPEILAVMQAGRPVVGGVSRNPIGGELTVPIHVPIPREDGSRFVLTADLALASIAEMLREVLPEGWAGTIIDRDGRIVVRGSDGAASAGKLASPTARQATAEQRAGEFRLGSSREGTAYAVLFLRSPLSGWTVHAGLPVDSLSVLQTGAVIFAAGGALASVLLAALLSWLLVRELHIWRRREAALAESQHLEALGRLTGGVAHDFNNLLMIIQGGAEVIKRRRSDPEQVAAFADGMASAAQRGAALTRQLLAYARREAHAPRTFRLGDRDGDLRTLLNQSTGPDIQLTLSIPDNTWPIFADPNALEVALINLAANARDAMPDGGRLTVSAANVSLRPGQDAGTGLAGDYVVIAVSDTGSGIAENHLDRIFEPFFTTKGSGQGTGLGLSQVYGFARQSGGAVTVRSEVGRGTVFRLYLRRSQEAPCPAVPAPAPRREAVGGRVLLVEDNAEVANATEDMLTAAGYTVAAAASAEAALQRLRGDEPFDVVLSDIAMNGGMSGLELAAHLRREGHGPPVVLMTGYSEALANGNESGDRILAKPFSEDQLVAALQAAREDAS